ncbi:MAG: biotin--[acetyl-CoA-carboxylase] ligase [Candidatus Aminicenantes bacterium RBG_16_63_14]|nr:MAG: biotin--[acetyl-CoA-carboxylase] ligase [Candidatus Aminicenantes bacterium RBG_16_63_14]OGD27409.1 MAG: biotin--[acetyl-CoA-carboxylase] ligase [Candidatus Aminicenantes bacterium RBG_19FT_COMBO_65_30]
MPVGTIVHRLESVSSTNDAARALALDGAAHGTAVVAGEQTRGRGTKGRTWHSPPGLGLYASFILRASGGGPVPFLHLLPLAAGLAASDAILAAAGIEVRLKWPNDLVHGGKKLGGILSESVTGAAGGDFAVVGVGVNVGHGLMDFPADLRSSATSLRLAGGGAATNESLFAGLCRALDCWYNALTRGAKKPVVRAFEERLAFPPGASIRVVTAAGTFMGTCRGLDAEGRLVVERAGAGGTVVLESVLGLDGA